MSELVSLYFLFRIGLLGITRRYSSLGFAIIASNVYQFIFLIKFLSSHVMLELELLFYVKLFFSIVGLPRRLTLNTNTFANNHKIPGRFFLVFSIFLFRNRPSGNINIISLRSLALSSRF